MNSAETIIAFVLDEAQHEPVRRRVALYRALADMCAALADKQTLLELAEALETVEERSRQFVFQFAKRRGETK